VGTLTPTLPQVQLLRRAQPSLFSKIPPCGGASCCRLPVVTQAVVVSASLACAAGPTNCSCSSHTMLSSTVSISCTAAAGGRLA
jgi:hypothetical protein